MYLVYFLLIELSDADESSFNFYGKGDENSL